MANAASAQSNNRLHIRSFLLQIFFVLSFFLSTYADAASIYLTPTQANVGAGETVRLKVAVNTQGVAINTVGGTLKFDPNELEILSINKANSVLNIWIEEPFFSNPTGTISFDGGVTTPGYTGMGGEIFSFTVKTKKAGVSSFRFDDVVILKNDGVGTDVLSSEGSATITVGKAAPVKQPVVEEPVKKVVTPLGPPVLTSTTHSDQQLWYTSKEARISWEKKFGVGVQMTFDSQPNTKPAGQIQYGIGHRVLQGIRDGVSYLHVRYVGTNTVSETSHFTIRVDTTSPSDIFATTTSSQSGGQSLSITAADITSGLEYAEVSIDQSISATKVIFENNTALYPIPADVQPGRHVANIKVFDKAGNHAEHTQMFDVVERSVFTISVQTVEVEVGTAVHITGSSTVPSTAITMFVKSPDAVTQSFDIATDEMGALTTSVKINSLGVYEIWAYSPVLGETNRIKVTAFATWKSKSTAWIESYLHVWLAALIVVIIVLLSIILRSGRKCSQRSLLRRISKLERSASAGYIELRAGVESQIKYLERLAEIRDLTDKEKMLYKKFRNLFE